MSRTHSRLDFLSPLPPPQISFSKKLKNDTLGFFNQLMNQVVPMYLLGEEASRRPENSEESDMEGMLNFVCFLYHAFPYFILNLSISKIGSGESIPAEEIPWHLDGGGEDCLRVSILSSFDFDSSVHIVVDGIPTHIQAAS